MLFTVEHVKGTQTKTLNIGFFFSWGGQNWMLKMLYTSFTDYAVGLKQHWSSVWM